MAAIFHDPSEPPTLSHTAQPGPHPPSATMVSDDLQQPATSHLSIDESRLTVLGDGFLRCRKLFALFVESFHLQTILASVVFTKETVSVLYDPHIHPNCHTCTAPENTLRVSIRTDQVIVVRSMLPPPSPYDRIPPTYTYCHTHPYTHTTHPTYPYTHITHPTYTHATPHIVILCGNRMSTHSIHIVL